MLQRNGSHSLQPVKTFTTATLIQGNQYNMGPTAVAQGPRTERQTINTRCGGTSTRVATPDMYYRRNLDITTR